MDSLVLEIQNYLADSPFLSSVVSLISLCLVAWMSFFISRVFLVRWINLLIKHLSDFWANCLDQRFLIHLSWLLPVIILNAGIPMVVHLPESTVTLVQRVLQATLVFIILRALTVLLGNINLNYSKLDIARERPIKGFIQVTLILLHLIALVLIVSVLINKSPWLFLSGLGAMTAIILLIFRDTLLSLVAGFQLTFNNLIRVGDWIEMADFGADGDVIDIALHTVKVQNWDKTITVIPAHKFLEHSFKNWRGMHESGGRRIKRAVNIDISTIRFLTEAEIEKLSRFVLLKDYMKKKVEELRAHNSQYAGDPELIVNSRRLTNIGTFRAYLTEYLRQHPNVNQNMTQLVRQLPPGPNGLPIEIYVFTNDVRWQPYEGYQADIFDHILAIAPEFGLRVFQSPTGNDVRMALKEIEK